MLRVALSAGEDWLPVLLPLVLVAAVVLVFAVVVLPRLFPWPSVLFVYLTEEEFQIVRAASRLGHGWEGWQTQTWPAFEGRIWATPYTRVQLTRSWRWPLAASAGFSLRGRRRVIAVIGDAAREFRRPWGFLFSWNVWGWSKGVIGNQYYYRGVLACSFDEEEIVRIAGRLGSNLHIHGVITSAVGATRYRALQMVVFRMGEVARLVAYTGVPLAVAASAWFLL